MTQMFKHPNFLCVFFLRILCVFWLIAMELSLDMLVHEIQASLFDTSKMIKCVWPLHIALYPGCYHIWWGTDINTCWQSTMYHGALHSISCMVQCAALLKVYVAWAASQSCSYELQCILMARGDNAEEIARKPSPIEPLTTWDYKKSCKHIALYLFSSFSTAKAVASDMPFSSTQRAAMNGISKVMLDWWDASINATSWKTRGHEQWCLWSDGFILCIFSCDKKQAFDHSKIAMAQHLKHWSADDTCHMPCFKVTTYNSHRHSLSILKQSVIQSWMNLQRLCQTKSKHSSLVDLNKLA